MNFWEARRVLVTGHTGFKGSWLAFWLQELGAEVFGCALDPIEGGAFEGMAPWDRLHDHRVDVRDESLVLDLLSEIRPEIIFHLAAQSLVRFAWAEPHYTFATNIMGTLNVLQAASRQDDRPAVVVVTGDKVYAEPGASRPRVESDCLGGSGPYETSKACAELVTRGWPDRALRRATARAGNVIGGGDVALDRIVPDILAELPAGRPVALRHPKAIRPWQHVLDPLAGYLRLGQRLLEGPPPPPSFNFGPAAEHVTVSELAETAFAEWGGGSWVQAPEDANAPEEAAALRLDSALANTTLGWTARSDAAQAVRAAVKWEKTRLASGDLRSLACEELARWGAP